MVSVTGKVIAGADPEVFEQVEPYGGSRRVQQRVAVVAVQHAALQSNIPARVDVMAVLAAECLCHAAIALAVNGVLAVLDAVVHGNLVAAVGQQVQVQVVDDFSVFYGNAALVVVLIIEVEAIQQDQAAADRPVGKRKARVGRGAVTAAGEVGVDQLAGQ